MKSIIKTCLVAIALMIGTSAYAQLPVQFGVNAGVNLSNLGGDFGDITKAKIGFQLGVTADYNITPELFLQSGLSFTTKGANIDYDVDGIENTSINMMYLQLPIRIGYKIPVTDAFKVNINAGPYLAYGLAGKSEMYDPEEALAGRLEKDKYDTFGDDGFKSFDFGLGFGVGAEFGKIGVNLGYELGLVDLGDSRISAKNNNAFLTLGYKF